MFPRIAFVTVVTSGLVPQEVPREMPPGSCVLPLPPIPRARAPGTLELPPIEIRLPIVSLQQPQIPFEPSALTIDWAGLPVDAPDPTGVSALVSDPRDLVLLDIPIGGVGDDVTFRRMVNRASIATDPRELCRLAHHLHVQATRRWGTLWVIDGVPLAALDAIRRADADPTRRAFALVAQAKESGTPWQWLVDDTSPLVRAAAARWLRTPTGVAERDAARVVAALFELARSDHSGTRVVAVRALGPWIHSEEQNAELSALVANDPDPEVRAAALESSALVRSLPARALAKAILGDDSAAASLRDAARRALAATGILPDE